MLRSIITTALRNLVRNRAFSIINIVGLSVSMSLALLVISVVNEQYTYDDFHTDADRIYRVSTTALRTDGGSEDYASAPLPIGRVFSEDYSFAEEVVRINARFGGDVIYGNVNVPVRGLMVDPSFLSVFNFPLERGSATTALSDPNSLVLTRAAAERIFGQAEPIGEVVKVGSYGEFVVTGVLENFPSKTHFEFEMLASMAALPAFEQQGLSRSSLDNWNNYYANYVYFKLKEGKDRAEAERALDEIYRKYYTGLELETRDRGYDFFVMALGEITPGPAMSNQMGTGMPQFLILFLGILAGIVMLLACFNYTNLMIAKSLSRVREIGVRKIVGARRAQVFLQFVGEAVVFSVVCLAFSYVLLQVLKPAFMQLSLAREFATELKEDYRLYVLFFAFAVGVGAVAGLLPAGYLSALRPASVLKDHGNVKLYARLTFRQALVVTQFALSIAFVIVVLVIYRQIDFMVTKDYGVHEENILNVRLQGMEFQKLANEVRAIPGVVSVGGVSHQLGTWADRASDYRRLPGEAPFTMRDFVVDNHYIDNLELTFVAGRNFDPSEQGVMEKHIILNERALGLFNFTNAVSAIGQPVYADDSLMLTVIGVVRDFHFRPLSYEIGPLALRYDHDGINFLSARILEGRREAVVASLVPVWKKLDPVHALDWKMMSDEIDEAYVRAGFMDIRNIVAYICFLVISLACLGMLGMAMYSTRTRVKEIGVRKVLGASATQVTLLLSKAFLVLLTIAAVVAMPVGYYFGDLFLEQYHYKITITPALLLTSVLIVAVLGVVTICSQTWKAAGVNPVKSLRYE